MVPMMSSMRFRRWRSSSQPGIMGSLLEVSEGKGAGGGMGRWRRGSGKAGAGLITSLHCSCRARGLCTTWLTSLSRDRGSRKTRTTLVVVSRRFFRK